MKHAKSTIAFAIAAPTFAVCCLIMLYGHQQLSRSPMATYAFVAVWGVSAIVASWTFVDVGISAGRSVLNRLRS